MSDDTIRSLAADLADLLERLHALAEDRDVSAWQRSAPLSEDDGRVTAPFRESA